MVDKFRRDALVQEFPFLVDCLIDLEQEVDSIKVKRWDSAVLEHVPADYDTAGSLVSESRREFWYAIADNELLTTVGNSAYEFRSNYAHSQNESRPGHRLIESLGTLLEAGLQEPQILVQVIHEQGSTPGRDLVDRTDVTVYKPSRGTSIKQLIEEARTRAAARVTAECDF